jgi:hypothetical protein
VTCGAEAAECVPEPLVAYTEGRPKGVTGKWSTLECSEDCRVDVDMVVTVLAGRVEHFEVRLFGIVRGERQRDGLNGWGCAMLDGEEKFTAMSAEIEVAVAPGVEIAGPAQALAGRRRGSAILARVMDDDDGEIELALQSPEISEEGRDIAGVVFVDPVQADEGVEEQQARPQLAHGLEEATLIAIQIEAQRGGGDDVDGQGGEIESAMATEPGDACLDDGGRVLRHVEQHATGASDVEATKARRGARDREGDVEREPTLAALRSAADDADARTCPELVYEPLVIRVRLVEIGGAHDGQDVVLGIHYEVSRRPVWTCSAVTVLCLETAAAMRA